MHSPMISLALVVRLRSGDEKIRMTPTGAATQLRFTHAGWQAETDYFVSCTTAWGN